MLALISSIPTTMREGFDVQDLPPRATPMSQEQMSKVFGGCRREGSTCWVGSQCCYKNSAGRRLACDGPPWVRRCVPR
jgi:hypothetical protein